MGFSKRNKIHTEKIITNEIGEEIHVFDGDNGKVRIKKVSMFSKESSNYQFCPDCHKIINHKNGYWECDICNYSITDEEVDDGEGFSTLEATYENDYGEIYGDVEDDIPDGCAACGGPYPECRSSCKMYD